MLQPMPIANDVQNNRHGKQRTIFINQGLQSFPLSPDVACTIITLPIYIVHTKFITRKNRINLIFQSRRRNICNMNYAKKSLTNEAFIVKVS